MSAVRSISLVLVSAFALASAACGTEGETTVAQMPPKATPEAPPAPTTPPPPPAPSVLRTVEQRNPFGNTAVAANLLVDGDFELTGRSSQMPWIAFGAEGQQTLNFETGGLCRSGVRCAKLAPSEGILGFLASPKVGGMSISLYLKPQSGTCGDAVVQMIDLDDQSVSQVVVTTGVKPAEGGWCHVTGAAPSFAGRSPVLYVEVKKNAKGAVLVDDGVILPEPPAAGARVRSLTRVPADVAARTAYMAAWLRRHRIFGVRPEPLLETPPARKGF